MKGMKGKGKGDRGSKTQDECPLHFPSLKPVDHVRMCPRYSAVLGRSRDVDCVGVEEVDLLQTELETLLAAAAKRMQLLQSELQLLDDWTDKGSSTSGLSAAASKDKAFMATAVSAVVTASVQQSSAAASEPAAVPAAVVTSSGTGGKRGSKGKSEEKPAKRMRTDSGRATYAQPSPTKSKGKVQMSKSVADSESPAATVATESPRMTVTVETVAAPAPSGRILSKNLTPNRFWALVEPYCADITPDDLQYLEDQIKACEDIGEFMKIPSLGRHYIEKWTEEDLMAERDSGKIGDRRKSSPGAAALMSNGSADATTLLRRVDDSADEDSSPFGPLTQRLIQGLLEENLVTPLDDANLMSEADAVEAATVSPRALAKQLHLGNTATLERRIRRELEEIGVFGADDEKPEEANGGSGGGSEGDDEILAELKKKQTELRALSHQNVLMLRHMHKQAKDEMQTQELRKKLATIDAEIIEAYRKVQASKAKKKSPTKKEKEAFYKALKERELVVKQLERTEAK